MSKKIWMEPAGIGPASHSEKSPDISCAVSDDGSPVLRRHKTDGGDRLFNCCVSTSGSVLLDYPVSPRTMPFPVDKDSCQGSFCMARYKAVGTYTF